VCGEQNNRAQQLREWFGAIQLAPRLSACMYRSSALTFEGAMAAKFNKPKDVKAATPIATKPSLDDELGFSSMLCGVIRLMYFSLMNIKFKSLILLENGICAPSMPILYPWY
jgi:hypothetical protein